MTLAQVLLLVAGTCPATAPAPGARGLAAVGRVPAEAAMRENAEGKKLYRQELWAEARGKYQAALAADPTFLGAQLNLACAFSREGRYAEAADQASKLVRMAYVPWQREVREAVDLGILQDQKDYARVQTAMAEAATEWGSLVARSVLFLARTKPPVNVSGEGALLLSLNQEVFAWNPDTGHYFQVTAEDGHVLGFVRSADKRRVAYLTGGKLVHTPGQRDVLRGLSLRVLDIATMALAPPAAIPAEVTGVELGFVASPEILVSGQDGSQGAFRLGEAGLEKIAGFRRVANLESLVVTTAGVQPRDSASRRTDCRFYLVSKPSGTGLWQVEVRRPGAKTFLLDARYGAGLPGLPFPDGSAAAHPAKSGEKAGKHDNK
jgi:hypothetical protein